MVSVNEQIEKLQQELSDSKEAQETIERELQLAAELGLELAHRNEELTRENEHLLLLVKQHRDSHSFFAETETDNDQTALLAELQEKLAQKEDEKRGLERMHAREKGLLMAEIAELRSELALNEKIYKESLAKATSVHKTHSGETCEGEELEEQLREEEEEEKSAFDLISMENKQLKSDISQKKDELVVAREQLQLTLESFENLHREYEALHGAFKEQEMLISELRDALESKETFLSGQEGSIDASSSKRKEQWKLQSWLDRSWDKILSRDIGGLKDEIQDLAINHQTAVKQLRDQIHEMALQFKIAP